MKALFINLYPLHQYLSVHPRHNIAPVDIGIAISILRKMPEMEISFIDTAVLKNFGTIQKKIKLIKADIVFIKPSVLGVRDALLLGHEIKQYTKYIFFVGPVANVFRELFLKSDFSGVIEGEWEAGISELIKTIATGKQLEKIPWLNIHNKKNVTSLVIDNLDALPFPAHDIFVKQNYMFGYPFKMNKRLKIGYMLSSRGCPYNCVFCSPVERASRGKKHRQRSARLIAQEALYLETLGVNAVYFIDDLFAINEDRFLDISDRFRSNGVKLKWALQARVGSISLKAAYALKKSGCTTVCLGVESGDDAVLSYLGKGFTSDDVIRQFEILHLAGLLTVAFLIIGSPVETVESIQKTNELIKKIKPHLLQIHFFTPYPGSKVSKKIPVSGLDVFNTKFDFTGHFTSKKNLKTVQSKMYRDFYFSPQKVLNMLKESDYFYLFNAFGLVSLSMSLIKRMVLP